MITLTKQEAQQVLDALEDIAVRERSGVLDDGSAIVPFKTLLKCADACGKLRAKLIEPEPEPVAYIDVETRNLSWAKLTRWETPTIVKMDKVPLYTAPPQREWQGLSDEEIRQSYETTGHYQTLRPQDSFAVYAFARAVETKLKEKNAI